MGLFNIKSLTFTYLEPSEYDSEVDVVASIQMSAELHKSLTSKNFVEFKVY